MEKLFVSYELSLKAKQKNYKEDCIASYWNQKLELANTVGLLINKDGISDPIAAPTRQQLVDWFRNKHKIQIEILWQGDSSSFCYKIGRFKQGSHVFSDESCGFKNYYSAFDSAILKAFDLI